MLNWGGLRTLCPVSGSPCWLGPGTVGGLQMLHRAQYRRTVASLIAVLVGLLLGQAYGVSFKAYGPQTFVRGKDAPGMQNAQFSVKYPNTQYTLVVVNGTNPYRPVESAVIRVNGVVVLRE